MSISSEIQRIQNAKTALKNKLNAKNDNQHQITNQTLDDYDDFVDTIQTGELSSEEYQEAINDVDDILENTVVPSGTISIAENGEYNVTNYINANVNVKLEKAVNFYDYDGTLLHSYTKSEFLALTELPANPTHTGLTSQGWNWSLSDAKTFVTDYNELDIGQTYTTTSGLSEFDIELNDLTGLTITFNMNGTKNWGDGTSDTATSHTYSTKGKYTITCNGTSITASYNAGIFGQGSIAQITFLKAIRFGEITFINNYAFHRCVGLETIVIPSNLTSFYMNAFSECWNLKAVVFPNSTMSIGNNAFSACRTIKKIVFPSNTINTSYATFKDNISLRKIIIANASIGSYCFGYCYNLKDIILSNSLTSVSMYAFYYNYILEEIKLPDNITAIDEGIFQCCFNLKRMTIPNDVTSISQYAFQNCYTLKEIIFPSDLTSIGSSVFANCMCLKNYDFSNCTQVPTLSNTNSFSSKNNDTKIIVPDNLYSEWITTNNWSSLTDYIVKASEV